MTDAHSFSDLIERTLKAREQATIELLETYAERYRDDLEFYRYEERRTVIRFLALNGSSKLAEKLRSL